jgi:fermentation-respiration switch protein FrsA (DUF1100 family)
MKRLTFALLACTACMRLDSFLYVPTRAQPGDDLLARATDVPKSLQDEVATDIVADDGTVVNAYILKHAPGDGTPASRHGQAVLYCHGNAKNIDHFARRVQALWSQGYTVLIFDYRGYGKTPGTPTEAGTYEDGRAARRYFGQRVDLGVAPERTVLYGYSLGAAICTQLAVETPAPGLILEAPFASVEELITDNADADLPATWFADAAYDNRDKISGHGGGLLVMHGSHDDYLQPRYGEEISLAAEDHAEPNHLWIVEGATHSTVPCAVRHRTEADGQCVGGQMAADYLDRVTGFIDTVMPP